MTTTVTTTTVTTVTLMGLTASLGILASVLLIALLVGREIVGTGAGTRAIQWSRTLQIGIAPLLFTFAVIVAVKLSQGV